MNMEEDNKMEAMDNIQKAAEAHSRESQRFAAYLRSRSTTKPAEKPQSSGKEVKPATLTKKR